MIPAGAFKASINRVNGIMAMLFAQVGPEKPEAVQALRRTTCAGPCSNAAAWPERSGRGRAPSGLPSRRC